MGKLFGHCGRERRLTRPLSFDLDIFASLQVGVIRSVPAQVMLEAHRGIQVGCAVLVRSKAPIVRVDVGVAPRAIHLVLEGALRVDSWRALR